jgi:O-antigen/teichoic acid export membrane protein
MSSFATASPTIVRSTVTSGMWTVGSYVVINIVRFFTNVVLTHLLVDDPGLMGLMQLVNAVVTGINLFSDIGVGPAVIQNTDGEREPFLRTAFTLQVLRGLAIVVGCCALAYPVSRYYGIPSLIYLIPVAGLSGLIYGLRSTNLLRLQKRVNLRAISILETIEIVISTAVMIVWCWFAPNIWALLISPLVGSAFVALTSHFQLRDRFDRFGWHRPSLAAIVRIGGWIIVSTALTFLAAMADRIILPKHIDLSMLAVYGVAVMLTTMPAQAIVKLGASVLFPTFSLVKDDEHRFRRAFVRARTLLMVIGATMVSGLIVCAVPFVNLIYKGPFEQAGWMIQVLSIGVWFQMLEAVNNPAILARGKPSWNAFGCAVKVVAMIVLLPLSFQYGYGLSGALWAIVISDVLRYVVSAVALDRIGVGHEVVFIDVLLSVIIAGSVAIALALQPHFQTDLTRFVVPGAVLAALWLPICYRQYRRSRSGRPAVSPIESATESGVV